MRRTLAILMLASTSPACGGVVGDTEGSLDGGDASWTDAGTFAEASLPDACPAEFDAGVGGPCPATGVICHYPQGACGCVLAGCNPDGSILSSWQCRPFTEDFPGCPLSIPPAGSACDAYQAPFCFGACCGGIPLGPAMVCSGGVWEVTRPLPCPCVNTGC
jgi:hypothetical protein